MADGISSEPAHPTLPSKTAARGQNFLLQSNFEARWRGGLPRTSMMTLLEAPNRLFRFRLHGPKSDPVFTPVVAPSVVWCSDNAQTLAVRKAADIYPSLTQLCRRPCPT
jgi:hypothetical protein